MATMPSSSKRRIPGTFWSSPVGQEGIDNVLFLAKHGSVIERRRANIALRMHICTVLQQHGEHRHVSSCRGNVQWRPSLWISGIDLRSLSEQLLHERQIACLCGHQQRLACLTLAVSPPPPETYETHGGNQTKHA